MPYTKLIFAKTPMWAGVRESGGWWLFVTGVGHNHKGEARVFWPSAARPSFGEPINIRRII